SSIDEELDVLLVLGFIFHVALGSVSNPARLLTLQRIPVQLPTVCRLELFTPRLQRIEDGTALLRHGTVDVQLLADPAPASKDRVKATTADWGGDPKPVLRSA